MDATLDKIYELYGDKDRALLLKAYNYAKDAHANQKRASGDPYFIHPCAVAKILMELGLDAATVAAALLHDVIEDTRHRGGHQAGIRGRDPRTRQRRHQARQNRL